MRLRKLVIAALVGCLSMTCAVPVFADLQRPDGLSDEEWNDQVSTQKESLYLEAVNVWGASQDWVETKKVEAHPGISDYDWAGWVYDQARYKWSDEETKERIEKYKVPFWATGELDGSEMDAQRDLIASVSIKDLTGDTLERGKSYTLVTTVENQSAQYSYEGVSANVGFGPGYLPSQDESYFENVELGDIAPGKTLISETTFTVPEDYDGSQYDSWPISGKDEARIKAVWWCMGGNPLTISRDITIGSNNESNHQQISMKAGDSKIVTVSYPSGEYDFTPTGETLSYISSDETVATAYWSSLTVGEDTTDIELRIVATNPGNATIKVVDNSSGACIAVYDVSVSDADTIRLCTDQPHEFSLNYQTENFSYRFDKEVSSNVISESTSSSSIGNNYHTTTNLEMSFSTPGNYALTFYDDNGKIISTFPLEVAEHIWDEGKINKEATCNEPGEKTYTCIVCGNTKTEEIPATGEHQWASEYTVDKEATCTEEGSKSIHCIICNEQKPDSSVSIPKTEHTWSDWIVIKQPTTSSEGERIRTCGICGKVETESIPMEEEDPQTESVDVAYRTHVQDYGTQDWVRDGGISGTTGQSKRLEGIWIQASATDKDQQTHDIPLIYQTHVQNYGWQDWKNSKEMAGTSGQSLRLEAIRINFVDDTYKAKYDIYYRVHAQNFGWLAWAKNGESSGTEGYAYRLEAIQILILSKGSTAPSASYGGVVSQSSEAFNKKIPEPIISYRTHVQNIGWQPYVADGAISGTVGKSWRLEAINLSVGSNPYTSGGITYSTHVQNIGWQDWKSDGELSGTTGQALRLEAIKIKLTGDLADYYDVYYRAHAQNFGWLAWVKNGAPAGTAGYAYRLEGIQVVLVKKDAAPPADNNFKGASRQSNYGFINKTKQELQIQETGYNIDEPNEYDKICYVNFCAKIINPNNDLAASFPTVTATAKRADGSILGTEDQVGGYIMPGDTVVLSGIMDTGTEVPATIDFTLKPTEFVKSSSVNVPSSKDFVIKNVSQIPTDFGTKITGQFTYNGTQKCNTVCVTALFKRGGKIVGSANTFVDNPVAGAQTAFEITPFETVPEYNSIEVSAQYWG
ncbi:MAG: hypothetical protein ACI4ET_11945 [Bilifractor sp.]